MANLFAEDENMMVYVDVDPFLADTIEDNKGIAVRSAEEAAQSAADARTSLNTLVNYKTGLELFYAEARNGIADLFNECITNINNLLQRALSDIRNLGGSIITQMQEYAIQVQETVDNNVSLDLLNSSKAMAAGSVASTPYILADVIKYAHSTYDSTKFTITNSAIINNGVASHFYSSGTDYGVVRTTDNITFGSTFDFYFEFTTPQSAPGSNQPFLITNSIQGISVVFMTTNKIAIQYGDGTQWITPNLIYGSHTLSLSTSYIGKLTYKGSKYELFTSVDNGLTWVKESEYTSATQFLPTGKLNFGGGRGGNGAFTGSMDLKQVKIINNGIPVFSGNKTGIDTYTINGISVSIPYTLSKTGSKIVDSAYRTEVTTLYEQEGYAPYYTLSDTDFTLPQGEIYGMMEKLINKAVSQINQS